jgi:tetratricopeptide (TPR) repeat protein
MNSKRKIKNHPEIDPKKDSLISKQAYIEQIKRIQAAQNSLRDSYNKVLEKILVASRPADEYRRTLEQLQKSLSPSHEYKKALEKILVNCPPSEEYKKTLEQLQKSLEPSEEYKKVLKEILVNYRPSEEYKKTLGQLQKSLGSSEEYKMALEKARLLRNVFEEP